MKNAHPFYRYLMERVESNRKKRFMSKVQKTKNGCWTMSAHKTKYDYHQFWMNGKVEQGHRAAYKLFKGAIPSGQVLRHTCNNRRCCNPSHMKLGSRADNNRDIARDGRGRNQHTGPLSSSPRGKGQQGKWRPSKNGN